MRNRLTLIVVAFGLALPVAAQAQSSTLAVGPSSISSKTVGIIGTAPAMCFGGTLAGDGTYDLGILIDTTTGLLRTDLTAPPKLLVGSFCTGRSTISIQATPMVAQNFTTTPPGGFSRSVDYVATASGWTVTPASYNTATTVNSAATQTRATSFTGDVSVAISGFSTTGGQLQRLVADNNYRGLVTVTIAAVN